MGAIVVAGFPSMKPNRRPISSTTMARCDQSLTKVTSAMCSRAAVGVDAGGGVAQDDSELALEVQVPLRIPQGCSVVRREELVRHPLVHQRHRRHDRVHVERAREQCPVVEERGCVEPLPGARQRGERGGLVERDRRNSPVSSSAASASRSGRIRSQSSSAVSSVGAMAVALTARVPSRATRCMAPSRVPFGSVASRTQDLLFLSTVRTVDSILRER